MVNLKDKIALVTGASGGMGYAISTTLAENGMHVILSARNTDILQKLKLKIEANGGMTTIIPADLSKPLDIFNMFKEITKSFKKLDVVINNAGVSTYSKFMDFTIKEFDKIMDVNLKSVFIICKEALNLMIPAKKGHIINISSILGIEVPLGFEDQTIYVASKHGLMGLTKGLSIEARKYGIKVSAILPGGTDTKMANCAWPDPDKRPILIEPQDIANSVLHLLSLSDKAMIDQIIIRRIDGTPMF